MDARTAVVVGGGISGLASAIALCRAGWEVQVLERSAELREVGAGISLWSNALHALDLLGIEGSVRAAGAVEAGAGFRDRAGSWLFRSDTHTVEERYGPTVLIRRAILLALLAEALPSGTVTLGAEVTDIAERGDHVHVEHHGGTTTAHLVVAADGIRSWIRSRLRPTAPGPRYAGYTTWRFTTPPLNLAAEVSESWGWGERVGIFPFGDSTIYSYLTATVPPVCAPRMSSTSSGAGSAAGTPRLYAANAASQGRAFVGTTESTASFRRSLLSRVHRSGGPSPARITPSGDGRTCWGSIPQLRLIPSSTAAHNVQPSGHRQSGPACRCRRTCPNHPGDSNLRRPAGGTNVASNAANAGPSPGSRAPVTPSGWARRPDSVRNAGLRHPTLAAGRGGG